MKTLVLAALSLLAAVPAHAIVANWVACKPGEWATAHCQNPPAFNSYGQPIMCYRDSNNSMGTGSSHFCCASSNSQCGAVGIGTGTGSQGASKPNTGPASTGAGAAGLVNKKKKK